MTTLSARIIDYMRHKKYAVFTGAKAYNIVYIEGINADGSLNCDAPNCFNDRRLVIEIVGLSPKIVGSWEATNEPGTYYTQHPMNPKGAARIAFGQYAAWSVGTHGRSEPHEALVQVAPIKVCRDLNKDGIRIGDTMDWGLFGCNQHHGYDLPYSNIGKASAGCLVGRTRSGHRDFMALIKTDVRYQRDRSFLFTTTVIAGDDLIEFGR